MSLNITLKLEAAGFSETLVNDYKITRCNITEDSIFAVSLCQSQNNLPLQPSHVFRKMELQLRQYEIIRIKLWIGNSSLQSLKQDPVITHTTVLFVVLSN
jgi:hypothetical protein